MPQLHSPTSDNKRCYRALQYRLDLYTLSKTEPSQWDIMLTFSGRPTRAILIIGMCLYSQADSAKLCSHRREYVRSSQNRNLLYSISLYQMFSLHGKTGKDRCHFPRAEIDVELNFGYKGLQINLDFTTRGYLSVYMSNFTSVSHEPSLLFTAKLCPSLIIHFPPTLHLLQQSTLKVVVLNITYL